MTKKQTTVVFILVSTVANIVIVLAILLLLVVATLLLFKENGMMAMPVVFMVALLVGSIVSQKLMNFAFEKLDLQDKVEPLFKFNRRNKKSRPE